MITVFTPSFADENNTNAQNLTVKEVVSRLPEDEFRVVMICEGTPDPRIKARKNTKLLPYYKHGNTPQLLARCLLARPDVYFYPRLGPLDEAIFGLRKNFRLNISIVTHIVMEMNDATGQGLLARSVLESDAVFGNSDFVTKTISAKFGVHARTIHNGIDRRFFFSSAESTRVDRATKTVLFAGSFQERKRVELVIENAGRRPDVNFRLVGQGETEAACRDLAKRLGCGNVIFLGRKTPAELGEEMRRADVFLFPSILEGHPQVLGQAAACGLPAVAMNSYQPDYIVSGQTGLLAASDQELSEKLDLLLGDLRLRHSMGAAAVKHSMKFDWDRSAERWADAFREVVTKR